MTSPFPTLNQHLVNPEQLGEKNFLSQPNVHTHPQRDEMIFKEDIVYYRKVTGEPTDNQGSKLLRVVFLKNTFLTPHLIHFKT